MHSGLHGEHQALVLYRSSVLPDIAQPFADNIANPAKLMAAKGLIGRFRGHVMKASVATDLVKPVHFTTHQVVLDEALLDGEFTLSGQVVIDPYVDFFPPKLNSGPGALVPAHDCAVRQDLNGILQAAASMSGLGHEEMEGQIVEEGGLAWVLSQVFDLPLHYFFVMLFLCFLIGLVENRSIGPAAAIVAAAVADTNQSHATVDL